MANNIDASRQWIKHTRDLLQSPNEVQRRQPWAGEATQRCSWLLPPVPNFSLHDYKTAAASLGITFMFHTGKAET